MKKEEIYVYVDSSNADEMKRLLVKYDQPLGDIDVIGGYHYLIFDEHIVWFVDNNDNKKVQITLSQLEGILKGDILKQNNMNTISRTDLGKIHNIACSTWKTKLEKLGSRNPFSGTIELTQSEVDEMFKAATPDQRPTLVNIFGEQSNQIDLTELSTIRYKINGRCILAVRSMGDYKDKGFYLDDTFKWEIVEDNYGHPVLIPTRK